jgi:hypothetical protein
MSILKLNVIDLEKSEYKGGKSSLCPGCGHDQISNVIIQAAWENGIKPEGIAKMSGIGCSSKTPAYFLGKSHGFNTVPGSSAFSESETLANSIYMNEVVPDADLYVTMHTGVWIMLYPWGKWPEQPSDWELFHHIRDDVNDNISEIPIRNANQGLYPNCGTSRDYGYGVMGFPTFTFETDDEQFLLGTVEALSDRLGEELDVMKYLVQNIWYWRARLVVENFEITDNRIVADVSNLGHASTSNATFHYSDSSGNLLWHSENFGINATNQSEITVGIKNLSLVGDGIWTVHYQKRVIDSSTWVEELIDESIIAINSSGKGLLPAPSLFIYFLSIIAAAISRKNLSID